MNTFNYFSFYYKLYAFMKALEINEIDFFIEKAGVKDFEKLGEAMKNLIKEKDEKNEELLNRIKELEKEIIKSFFSKP